MCLTYLRRLKSYKISAISTVLLALTAGAFCFTVGRTTELLTADGNWWQSTVPYESQVYVIQGILDAYDEGWSDGALDQSNRILKELEATKMSPANQELVLGIAYRKDSGSGFAELAREPRFSRTFGYYTAAISDYYARHPSAMSNTTVGKVVGCLADNPSDRECSAILKP